MKGTWQTTDGGGGLTVPLAVGAAALAVLAAAPVAAALAAVAEALVITIAVLGALVLLGGAAFVTYRLRHSAPQNAARVTALPRGVTRAARPLPGPRPRVLEAPRPELHLHFHGVTAEDVAEIIDGQDTRGGTR
jgi:hypothetical protein